MNVLRAMMVDLDGTLAHTSGVNGDAYRLALSEVGVEITVERFQAHARSRNWRDFLPEIFQEARVNADPAQVAARKAEIYRAILGSVSINWALVRLVEACHGPMRTALVTTASSANVGHLLEVHGLEGLFDTVVTGDDVSRHKPDPEAYALAASRLGVEPDECLIYEDSDEGVKSAIDFGAHVIRVVFDGSMLSVRN